VLRICHYAPVARKDLVGPPAEQERVGALVDLVRERRGLVVEQRDGPSAALESAPAVLVLPAESLPISSVRRQSAPTAELPIVDVDGLSTSEESVDRFSCWRLERQCDSDGRGIVEREQLAVDV
jgi:hypothetical protein